MFRETKIRFFLFTAIIIFSLGMGFSKEDKGNPLEDLQKQIDELKERVKDLETHIPPGGFVDYSDKIAGIWEGVSIEEVFEPPDQNLSEEFNCTITFSQPDAKGRGAYAATGVNPFMPWWTIIAGAYAYEGYYQIIGDTLFLSFLEWDDYLGKVMGYGRFSISLKIFNNKMRFVVINTDRRATVGIYQKIN